MIYFFCYYTSDKNKGDFVYNFGSTSKIAFIARELAKKDDVTIVSFCDPKIGRKIDTKPFIENDKYEHPIVVQYVFSKTSSNKLVRFLKTKRGHKKQKKIIKKLLKNGKNNKVLIYHSLYFLKLEKFLAKRFNKQSLIQVEDVYSITFAERYPKWSKLKDKEINILKSFQYGILITKELQELLETKQYVISNGVLKTINKKEENKETINLIYSGIIDETYRSAFNACELMRHLPDNYHLNICGNGHEESINNLKDKINKINSEKNRNVISFYGLLSGKDLDNLYLKSDIGLSIESNATSVDRQKYSFHSKILKYLSCSIPVVCTDYISERNSSIADLLTFVPNNYKISEIAKTVKETSLPSKETISKRISEEYEKFSLDLKKLLNRFYN